MASRQPIKVDIGDGKEEYVLRFSASYAKALKQKHTSLAEMLKVESEDLLPKLLLDGLKDSPYKTEDEIRDAMDAGAQLEIVLKVLEALTGNRVAVPGEAKNAQTQTVQ